MARAQGQVRARSVWTDVSNSGLPFLSAWFVCVLVKVEGAERPLFFALIFWYVQVLSLWLPLYEELSNMDEVVFVFLLARCLFVGQKESCLYLLAGSAHDKG